MGYCVKGVKYLQPGMLLSMASPRFGIPGCSAGSALSDSFLDFPVKAPEAQNSDRKASSVGHVNRCEPKRNHLHLRRSGPPALLRIFKRAKLIDGTPRFPLQYQGMSAYVSGGGDPASGALPLLFDMERVPPLTLRFEP